MTEDENKQEVDWSQYGDHEMGTHTPLDGKDYVALFIASLQSVFLPLVILAIVLGSIGVIFALLP